ncbi:SDR family oxidoreductase [Kocuria rhizophila]|nr:SDR family oxidoreductase [Kocuria rhizophila]
MTANGIRDRGRCWPGTPAASRAPSALPRAAAPTWYWQFTVGDDRGDAGVDWQHPWREGGRGHRAARGIGEQVTRTLAASGATAVPRTRPQPGDALSKLANELRAPALQLDVTDPQAGRKTLDLVASRDRRLDPAGATPGSPGQDARQHGRGQVELVIAVNIESQPRINETLLASDKPAPPRTSCASPPRAAWR